MELPTILLEGWLIKSPPEKKAAGPFKLFKAKWRKRFFVLYEPLASQTLPGTRAALDYFKDDRHQKKLGTIDLDHCEEVLCKLDTAFYRHVFSLRTKHKGRDRTYYLASDTEEVMMKWVDCLCLALGLKENDDPVPPSIPPAAQQSLGAPAPQSATTQSIQRPPVQSVPVAHTEIQSEHAVSPPRQINSTKHQAPEHTPGEFGKGDGYIPLEDCVTGKQQNTVSPSRSVKINRKAEDTVSVDSIPLEPPPAIPPAPPKGKGSSKLKDFVPASGPSVYDNPKKSYVNFDDNENVLSDEGIYKVPKGHGSSSELLGQSFGAASSDEEGVYKVPRDLGPHQNLPSDPENGIYKMPRPVTSELYQVPPAHPQPVWAGDPMSDGEGWYDVPPLQPPPPPGPEPARGSNSSGDKQQFYSGDEYSRRSNSDTGDLYDVPKQFSHGSMDYRTSSTLGRGSTADVYDNPRTYRKTQSENNLLESVVPAPPKPNVGTQQGFGEGRYRNLPDGGNTYDEDPAGRRAAQRKSSHPRPPSYQVDDVYDIPPKQPQPVLDADKLVTSPPPPKPCTTTKHAYINTPHHGTDPRVKDHPAVPYHGMNTPVVPPGPNTNHESFYMPMSASLEIRDAIRKESASRGLGYPGPTDVYTDMKSLALQQQDIHSAPPSSRSPISPSVHDVVPPPKVHEQDTYSIFPAPTHTHRTRSFKRPLLSGEDVALPTRKNQSEASSSDDESSGSGSHDRSGDSLSFKPMPPHGIMTSTAAVSKMSSLNCTPPPPKNPGEVQYLDLALEDHSDLEKSPLSARAPTNSNASPTDYREIDFIKTKALNEMQKDVESKRKSSERSVDD